MMRDRILKEIESLETAYDVRVLFAVESGSRAWGFPSPDSDYDVRFIYHHPRDWYLSLRPGQDVIELPIIDNLDINGWDLRKALNLMLKGNPTIFEWLRSPIIYKNNSDHRLRLTDLADQVSHVKPATYHYLHLAKSQYQRYIKNQVSVPFKKYFYVVRPVLALMWLRERPRVPVPMDLKTLIAGVELDDRVGRGITGMVELKSKSKEMEKMRRFPDLDAWIEEEIEFTEACLGELVGARPKEQGLRYQADDLFRRIINE